MAKWHQKVEVRVTQTFRQLNIRRIIDIIGYDPSSYFKGEMSYHNMEQLKKGDLPANIGDYTTKKQREAVSASASASPLKKKMNKTPVFPGDQLNSKLGKIESMYRNDNLN